MLVLHTVQTHFPFLSLTFEGKKKTKLLVETGQWTWTPTFQIHEGLLLILIKRKQGTAPFMSLYFWRQLSGRQQLTRQMFGQVVQLLTDEFKHRWRGQLFSAYSF